MRRARSHRPRLDLVGSSRRARLLSLVLASVMLGGVAASGRAQEDGGGPLLRATVDDLPALPVIVELTRIELGPGAGLEVTVPGPEIYAVESGTFGLRLDAPGQLIRTAAPGTTETASPGVDYVLRPGDQAVVPANVPQVLLNDGEAPAKVLSAVIFPASSAIPSWLPAAEPPPGVSFVPVVSDIVAEDGSWPSGPANVAAARATVGEGDEIPSSMLGDFALLVVEQGTLGVTAEGEAEAEYGPGEVARLGPGAPAPARNAGKAPLTALILTIEQAPSDTGTLAAGASPAASVPGTDGAGGTGSGRLAEESPGSQSASRVGIEAGGSVVAVSPEAGGTSIAGVGLVGLYLGIGSVAIGLMCYPVLRRTGRRGGSWP